MRRIGTLDGLFNGGDPATNTKGTVVAADWLNGIQEELAAVVEGLGGTLNPADGNQVFDWLLASFANIGGNAAQTFRAALAAQFDSSSYVATTEFVKRRGLQFSNVLLIVSSTILTAADAGKLIWVAGPSSYNIVLPALSTVPAGATFEFFSSAGSLCPVIQAGTDILFVNGSAGGAVSVGDGDTLRVTANPGSGWAVNGGSAQIGKSAAFGKSFAANGYQKLPSGFIGQWGAVTSDSGGNVTWTFPVAFPNACLGVSASPRDILSTFYVGGATTVSVPLKTGVGTVTLATRAIGY